MPIFMDRHDLQGATAADLAEAHLKDIQVQDRYGVRFLTYWFDEPRGTVFCLVDAPNKEAVQCVHREAHGFVAAEIVEVPLSAVEGFLGRIQDPQPPVGHLQAQMDSGHRAIMFTDIVDSTAITARLGDLLSTELIRAHDALVRRSLRRFDGREVKHLGDGIMACFGSTIDAVDCAIEVQQAFGRYNEGSNEPIHIRIGLDAGEPIEDSDDLFGSTVQMAARLCAAAAGDQILVSENIQREDSRTNLFVNMKLLQFKGFSGQLPAFECHWLPTDNS
jgi:class 3 adenylate cyclase